METVKEHLKLLSIFHYIMAGLTALFSLIPIFHVVMGIGMMEGTMFGSVPAEVNGEMTEDFKWMGTMFVVVGGAAIILGETFAILLFIAAKKLANYRSRLFCQVIAGISCLSFPFGTALGIFSLITLTKPETGDLFTS